MSFKLFACGDYVNSKATDFCDDNLKKKIQSCDASICNFEAPIELEKAKLIAKAGPHVRQSKVSIDLLKKAGFGLVNLANNHICDYGEDSLFATINELKDKKIKYVGAGKNFDEAYSPLNLEANGIKIGILAGCENEFGCLYEQKNSGGYAWIFSDKIEDSIRDLKSKNDFVIFIAHAGVEEIEIPIKEWRDRYKRLCELGCDVVIGHHPHVPQGYEKFNKSIIFYSLGNFYFDTNLFKNNTDDSFSVIIKFEKERETAFEIVYHKKIGNKVSEVEKESVNFNLNELNKKLGNDYEKQNNEICLNLFNKYYYRYYKNAIGGAPADATLMETLKFSIKKFLLRRPVPDNKILLLHNIRIDSHRFAVQRALSLICE